MNYWVILLTGLTTGGLSCLAVQGGLLTGVIANIKERERADNPSSANLRSRSFDKNDWLPVTFFLGAKLVSHTLFGFLLGALGSVLTLSLGMRITFQAIAALFMFAAAMNLLDVHPIFRFVAFQPPRFVRKLMKLRGRGSTVFAPATLGFLTILIPCGVTQAMELVAVSTGSAIAGGLVMFFFVLGTFPLFGALGVATAKLSESFRTIFLKFAAVLLIFMSLYGINGVLQVLDFPVTAQKIAAGWNNLFATTAQSDELAAAVEQGVQKVTVDIQDNRYVPNAFSVKAGIPIELTLTTNDVYTCASAFTFRAFDIVEYLKPTDRRIVRFTPMKKGKFTFACSMGMYTGSMTVL